MNDDVMPGPDGGKTGSDLESPPQLDIGQVFHDRYQIESKLGEGGMGVLYLASHKTLPKKFVVKVVRLAPTDLNKDVVIKRFRREARSIARIEHPNVVSVVDYDVWQGTVPFIIMDFIEGETLREFMERHPEGIRLDMFGSFMYQLCDAMEVVHQAGIVHRDLKPTNIMIQSIGGGYLPKILDFGLAHLTTPTGDTTHLKLTTAGQLIGTPYYMAPEQCRELDVTPRTDVYAVGLLAYEMLTGRQAIQGQSFFDVLRKQIKQDPDPIQSIRPEVPDEVAQAIHKALAKDPQERFESMTEFQQVFIEDEERTSPSVAVTGAFRAVSRPPASNESNSPSIKSWIPWAIIALIGISVLIWKFLL